MRRAAAERAASVALRAAAVALPAAAARPAAAVALLVVRAAAARADLPAPVHGAEQVHRTVRQVLAQPEFQGSGDPLLVRVVNWLAQQLARLLAAIGGGGHWSLLGLGLLALVLAAVVVAVSRFARGMTPDPEAALAHGRMPRRSADDWRAEAERHEAAGEWREAVRCRYRALVADLAARGLVEELPGRTAGEYRGAVRRSVPALADDFAGVTELFERAWYGNHPTGQDAARQVASLAARVLERAR
jgi:hypothetical protein